MVGEVISATRGEVHVLVQDNSHHNYGHTSNTANTYNAPVTTIQRADIVKLVAHEDFVLLDSLPRHPDTSNQWNDYLEDSRDEDIQRIRGWAGDLEAKELILWVDGPAGTGKSTLARQLKHDLRSHNRLAASVFLSVLPTDTWGPETVIRLIGGEIGRIHHNAIPMIAEAVRQCHGASLPVLVEMFIRNPLQALQLQYPLIVVMDAADEWRSHYQFISELTPLSSLSSLIRFVVLGRSEPRPERFKGISIRPHHLLPVSVEVMQRYLNARFENIKWPFGRKPGDQEVLNLAEMAGGLFIWIANVCSLLERPRANPHDTLSAILLHRHSVGEGHILAKLYFDAIGMLFPEPDDKEAVRDLLGFLLVLQEPVSVDAFSLLCGMDARAVTSMMSDLKVLQIRYPADSLTTVYPASKLFHASFTEYLTSTSTPAGIAFPISLPPFHLRLGIACLGAVAQIPAGSQDLALSPKSTYGVKLWPYHIVAGSPPVEPDLSQLEKKVKRWHSLRRLSRRIKVAILKHPTEKQNNLTIRTNMTEILEGVVTFAQLCRWAPLFLKALHPDYTSAPPSGDNIPSLMQAVAGLLDTTATDAVVFKIPCLEVAVQVTPNDAENWGVLGHTFRQLADTTDSPEPIHQSVRVCQHALDVAHAFQIDNQAHYTHSLAVSLWNRAQRLGTNEDLQKAITLEREALGLLPAHHPDRRWSLNGLAGSLYTRFNWLASAGDLEEAIALHQQVLELCPSGHPSRSWSLNNLANALNTRFKLSADAGDLEEAIVLHWQALELRPSGHPDRSRSLNNLALALHSRFNLSADAGDLEEAIQLHRQALELHPSGHPDRPSSLHNLACSLHSHFKLSESNAQDLEGATLGSVGDLDEAIEFGQEVLVLQPKGHPWRLDTLWNQQLYLYDRFRVGGAVEDLQEAIALAEEALALYPADGSDYADLQDNITEYEAELAEALSVLHGGFGSDE